MKGAWSIRVLLVAVTVLVVHLGIAPDLRIAGVAAELPIGLAIGWRIRNTTFPTCHGAPTISPG